MKKDFYQEVTNKVIDVMENGVLPWVCPWDNNFSMELPLNYSNGNHYQGINIFLLWMAQMECKFSYSAWMTYKQAQALGGQVRKGSKGTSIVFYKQLEKETGVRDDNGKEIMEYIPVIKEFTVFNLDQIDGIEKPAIKEHVGGGFEPIEWADQVLRASGLTIHESGTRAFYRKDTDEITMPERVRFSQAEDYYATALHELTHATGHKTRCDRQPYKTDVQNGAYAFEELVAELGASFCMAELGLNGSVQSHANYLNAWLTVLKEDKRAIFRAASQAQKAHEWIQQQMVSLKAAA